MFGFSTETVRKTKSLESIENIYGINLAPRARFCSHFGIWIQKYLKLDFLEGFKTILLQTLIGLK